MSSGDKHKPLVVAVGATLIISVFVLGALEVKESGLDRTNQSPEMFTAKEVSTHNSSESCWVSVDGQVFNMTPVARHPIDFSCGEDVSDSYHRQHGELSSKMMALKVGKLENVSEPVYEEDRKNLADPKTIYFQKEWQIEDLMMVIEKQARSLLIMGGETHERIARIENLGYQPHTQVFPSQGDYTYLVSRDGFVTKIDLQTLKPVETVKVANSSRGTAVTSNGEILAIGNYEPRDVVLLNTTDLEVIKRIELRKDDNLSRAGALVGHGSKFLVALKDLNGVWSIETSNGDIRVTDKFWDVGRKGEIIHDGYITSDSRYFVVAAQGSNRAWFLDLQDFSSTKEIVTGRKPHPGPGATWGDKTFLTSLGEGNITAINTSNWETEYISTGGPGFFVRSYSRNSSYPYIWADAAFGDARDEIYVIDARENKVMQTLKPVEDERSIHPEFTYDGEYVYVSVWTADKIAVYNSRTFKLVKLLDAATPTGISNVGLRIEEPGL